jgi:4-amino-4-deoxy-L-arabinose transferase-like glycosyltransferase
MTTIALPDPTTAVHRGETPPPSPRRGGIGRLVRGRDDDPRWVRPCVVALLGATALLYLWSLGASGWANSYYAAAVQAGAKSWKAFFFGSTDASNFITVDKAPAFLWPMELSARIFGVGSWSMLVPQALEGVAAVAILYAAVRRWFGPAAGLLAGAVLALTPVAALMFRFNNPDSLLTLLLIASAYAMIRALETGRSRWLVLVGSLVGFGFLAKMLQALLVIPALGLVYLVAGPPQLGRRIKQLVLAGVAFAASAGWWVLAVQLTPASARPYIGGSQNNSLWNLIFGYNGFGRLTGTEAGSVGGGGNGNGRWGPTGWTRLFNTQFGGQISWLLPAALIVLVAVLAFTWRTPRVARTRAAMMLWGGWLAVTGAAISLGKGIIHPYYTVALAPAIGAVIGIGSVWLWRERHRAAARIVLAAAIATTAVWSFELLGRTPTWYPTLRALVLVGGLGAAAAIAARPRLGHRAGLVVASVAVVATMAGPAAYALATAATPHGSAIPSAGPAGASGLGPGVGGPRGLRGPGGPLPPPGAFGPARGGAPFPGGTGVPPPFTRGGTGGRAAGVGGILNGSTPTGALVERLSQDASRYTWAAATVSANQAAGYQLATGAPVMAIGGFNGTDPAPTLAEFQQYVRAGKIHYFIAGGRGGGMAGGNGTGTEITSWVQSNFSSTSIGGVALYDLTSAISAAATPN